MQTDNQLIRRIKKKQEEIQRMHELDFATGMLVQQDD